MILRSLIVVLAVLLAAPSLAVELRASLPNVTLSPEKVEAVLAAYVPMRARIEALGTDLDADGNAGDVAMRLIGLAEIDSVGSALDGPARDYGFDGYLDWLATTYAVFMAHGFAQHPGADDDLQKALDEVEGQTGLSAPQKELMRQMLLHSMHALAAIRPPEENIAAVAPYRDWIEAILTE